MWAVDREETGEWKWEQPEEEKPGSIESVSKETINIDEEGYETVRRPRQRNLGQFMPEIFAVEAEALGECSKKEQPKSKEASKKKFCGSDCSKKMCNYEGWEEKVRSSMKEIGSVEKATQKTKGEVSEARATPGWERVRIQVTPGPSTR